MFTQDLFNNLMPWYNDLRQRGFDSVMSSQLFSKFIVLYDKKYSESQS